MTNRPGVAAPEPWSLVICHWSFSRNCRLCRDHAPCFVDPLYAPSKPATQSFVLPLKGGQPVQQIQDDRNAREVYAQRFAEASDHAQSRDGRRIKKRPRAFLLDRLYQSELHKSFDQGGMHARARGQRIERQLLTLVPAKNELVSPHGHHLPPGIKGL